MSNVLTEVTCMLLNVSSGNTEPLTQTQPRTSRGYYEPKLFRGTQRTLIISSSTNQMSSSKQFTRLEACSQEHHEYLVAWLSQYFFLLSALNLTQSMLTIILTSSSFFISIFYVIKINNIRPRINLIKLFKFLHVSSITEKIFEFAYAKRIHTRRIPRP